MVTELLDESIPIRFTRCIGGKPNDDTFRSVICELEGEIVTLWESKDIPQTELQFYRKSYSVCPIVRT